jgi:transposase-like protein
MGRRARVDRTAEQKQEIVLEGMRNGNISESCRRYEIAANLYCRWKDEALRGATAALGGKSAAAVENEKDWRIHALVWHVCD